MISLISANWLYFLIALIIGVATAYWIWARRRTDASDHFNADDGLLDKADEAAVPTAAPAPPEPVIAEPAPPKTVTPKTVTPKTDTPPVMPVAEPEVAPAPVSPEPAPVPVADADPKPAPTKLAAAPAVRPRKRPAVAETAPPPPPGKPNIPPAVGEPDNLRLIKGVGPKLNTLLNNLGVTRFDQIAEWKEEEIQEVDQYLESFSGRITRDSWIGQAKYLAKDDIAGFEQKYGKL